MLGNRAGAGRFVAAAAALFLLAILVGRFLISDTLWPVALLVLPILLLVLSIFLGFGKGLLLVAFFVAASLAFEWVVRHSHVGWAVAILGPVLLLATYVAARVAKAMWQGRGGEGPGKGPAA